ncbi:type IV pilin N-terminal domain-containing protein [Methanosarcina sp. 1.H.T.1A.1]|uniref:type IV pilin N-terminal domain-containing protein n=1 Tax=Methanosarcina sp. 1.H.T.1A.1 TaxID=1483602 RepID=UPI001F312416|nr:type IV pilin N-terminal domain-containing protein [Methanosarcina sp. 1.H.T.1A.1]
MGLMLENLWKFLNSSDSVSGIMGEVLLASIAVIIAGMFSTMVFSLDRPVDSPHVAVEKWARAPTDIIYIRHCGGDVIDTDYMKIIASIDGSSYVYSPDDVFSNLNKSTWDVGDVITINVSDKWGASLTKGDPVYLSLVDMDSKQVFRQAKVIPGGGGSGGWLPPAQVDDSSGPLNSTDVMKEGDGKHTNYVVPQKNTPEVNGTGEVFSFGINMADYDYRIDESVSNVTLRFVYSTHDSSFEYIELWIFDAYPSPGQWYMKSSLSETNKLPKIYVMNLSDRINTVEDVEGLKVRIKGVGNAASAKEINVDYMAIYFE